MRGIFASARLRLRRFSVHVVALALFLSGLYVSMSPVAVFGADLTNRSDTLSTSAFSTAAKHTIVFTTATALTTDGAATADFSTVVNLPTNAGADPFTLPTIATGDVTLTCTSCATSVLAATAVELSNNGGHSANDELLIAWNETGQDSTAVPIGSVMTLTIGTGSTKITNPANDAAGCTTGSSGAADICIIAVHTTEGITGASPTLVDSGDILVAVNDGVSVSATVDETLSFSVDGVASGSCTGDTGSPTAVTTTDTTVPFGTLSSANAFYAGCQTLGASTNGSAGYTVVASENQNLKSGAGDYIVDTTCDSSCTTSSGTAWATATNTGLGYYCANGSGSPCATAGDSNTEYRQFACTGTNGDCNTSGAETPVTVLSKTTPQDSNVATIHYKISIPGTQAAGTYSNTITYVATPTF